MPRLDDTFLLYYYEEFAEFEESNPCGLYCLSESTIQIILSALRFSTWPTRWRLNKADYSRAISQEYWDVVKGFGELAYQEVIKDMSCDFEAGFTALAEAITEASNKTAVSELAAAVAKLAEAQCCDDLQIDVNGGFQGTVTSPEGVVTPIMGSQPPIGVDPGEFPPEFEDEDEYLLSKCQMANYIADGVIGSLRGLSNLTIAQFTIAIIATVVAFATAIVIPPAIFPALMMALGVLGATTGLIFTLAEQLEENRDDFVCLLYEGDNASSVIGSLGDFIDTMIALVGTTGPFQAALKIIFMSLVNSDTINQLFSGRAKQAYGSADCGECGCENWEWTFNDNTYDDWEATVNFPACFTHAPPPLCGLSANNGQLVVTGTTIYINYKEAGIHGELPGFVANPGWILDIDVVYEGSTSMYLSACLVCSDGTCIYEIIEDNQTTPGAHYEVSYPALDGKTITDIYVFMASGYGAGNFLVKFNNISFLC